jgi:hypothetical protein
MLAVGWLAYSAAGRGESGPSTSSVGETGVRVLQLNLCNSGLAGCYSDGRAVTMASTLIRHDRPDLVTLNEVCRDDVDVLEGAMSAAFDGATVATAFEPAQDRGTSGPVSCRNGQDFGDGVLAVVRPATRGFRTYGGVHPVQDVDDPEERVWVCLDLADRFAGCTTHATSRNETVALAQCRYLLGPAGPAASHRGPFILGGDLNITAGGSPSPQSCLPPGYERTDDGALQHVVVSSGVRILSHSVIDMRGTTDHPGLLVELRLAHQ